MNKIFEIQSSIRDVEKSIEERYQEKPRIGGTLSGRYSRTTSQNERSLIFIVEAHRFAIDCIAFYTGNMREYIDSRPKEQPEPKHLIQIMENGKKECENYISTLNIKIESMNSVLAAQAVLAKKINSEEIKDDAKVYELLKRLAVGFIVGSFFLVIIKYLAQQYSFHLLKYDKTNQEEIQIRKFYLGYELARDDDIKKSELLKHWISPCEISADHQKVEDSFGSGLGDNDKKIISEILEILKKKI